MSIRMRLALWYGVIFGVVLLVFSAALYAFMAQHLDRMLDNAIGERADHLVTAILATNPFLSVGDTPKLPVLEAFEAPEVYVQILSADGSVLGRSANLTGHELPVPEKPMAASETVVPLGETNLRSSLLPAMIEGQVVAWVQVASSYRQNELVLTRLRWVLLGGGLAAVAAVVVVSGALAGRALRPVSDMTETARAIALSRGFSRRLSAGSPGDELGQLALTFNEMLASLEEAYTAQQRFTADASHELRAPLTAIRGNLDLLDRIKDMPEEQRRQTLEQVRREVGRLSRLVNDLLALARADAGQVLEFKPVELDALLVDVHHQARAMADGVEVRLQHIEPVTVQGDGDRLKELLLILVDNAIRYTSKGGLVSLWLKRDSPWVSVGVEDTGIGIDREDLPHIFERFWRADRARSRDSGGTGLGLSIAKWIVDRHGGEILVDSTPGKGSRFTIHLPAQGM